ncbi:hypothetical protein ACN28C_14590 [Plantactinospora sp. WMMC1484]|uniref:hypothetical protein n=1 Tax=Plantactinospora sp. WMMC1484 TaxID=3404122 RepID=UPI003BF49D3B
MPGGHPTRAVSSQLTRPGVRVIEVDGSRDADGVADLVAEHFAPFLAQRSD